MARGRLLPPSRLTITTLAGGVGAAKFIRGLVRRVDPRHLSIVVNTGDDEDIYGLHVSPDVDTIIYTLAGVVSRANGWGLEGETFNALGALARFYGTPWFNLGDRDLATHLYRTQRLDAGARLSEVTAEIAQRFGASAHVMPMSNDRVRAFVSVRVTRTDSCPQRHARGPEVRAPPRRRDKSDRRRQNRQRPRRQDDARDGTRCLAARRRTALSRLPRRLR